MNLVVGGRSIEAAWVGPATPGATALVFLHEGLGCLAQWRDFPARVAEATGLGALVYSRFGYGASDPVPLPRPLTYMHDEARVALPAVLDAAGIDRAILVGHSDGASIAIVHAAEDDRARVAGVALLAPHVFVEDVSIRSIEAARAAYESGDLRERLAKYHAHVDVAFRGWNGAWLDPAFRAWNLEAFLPRIRVPVAVIQGEDDPYGTRAQVDAIARQAGGPVEVTMLARCGHAPHRDRPDETLAAIARLVDLGTAG
jgi:pimeloyl-ACP methyl ester carboxylesterase